MSNELTVMPAQQGHTAVPSIYGTSDAFDHGQRVAKMLALTTMIPKEYQNNIANCMVALEMSNRMNVSPLMVMQNLNVIHGKPSWSSTYLIAAINTCGKFSPLRWRTTGTGDDMTCVAYATELATGEVVEGPPCSIAMAKKEGWYGKNGSKWPTMPELMLRYRAAAFFSRLYAPELAMGIHTQEETIDAEYEDVTPGRPSRQKDTTGSVADLNAAIEKSQSTNNVTTGETGGEVDHPI